MLPHAVIMLAGWLLLLLLVVIAPGSSSAQPLGGVASRGGIIGQQPAGSTGAALLEAAFVAEHWRDGVSPMVQAFAAAGSDARDEAEGM